MEYPFYAYNAAMNIGAMFGFLKEEDGRPVVANRIFEMHLYQYFLSEEMLGFLLYLRPIINGTGNFYVEAQTRDVARTDVVVDYRGKQYVIELKIWRGPKYKEEGCQFQFYRNIEVFESEEKGYSQYVRF